MCLVMQVSTVWSVLQGGSIWTDVVDCLVRRISTVWLVLQGESIQTGLVDVFS